MVGSTLDKSAQLRGEANGVGAGLDHLKKWGSIVPLVWGPRAFPLTGSPEQGWQRDLLFRQTDFEM